MVGRCGALAGQQAAHAAAQELDRRQLEVALPGLVPLEHRPWACAERAMVQENVVWIQQKLVAKREMPRLGGIVKGYRLSRRHYHASQGTRPDIRSIQRSGDEQEAFEQCLCGGTQSIVPRSPTPTAREAVTSLQQKQERQNRRQREMILRSPLACYTNATTNTLKMKHWCLLRNTYPSFCPTKCSLYGAASLAIWRIKHTTARPTAR